MTDVAKADKARITRLALIDSLDSEIDNKIKTLSEEVKDNPGLRPVLNKYIQHVNEKNEEAAALQTYFHHLLQSLYKIEVDDDGAVVNSHQGSSSGSKTNLKSSKSSSNSKSNVLNQLGRDEKAIVYELNKWTTLSKSKK